MSLHEENALVFQNVTKIYRLYQNQWQMVKDALGFKSKQKLEEFFALKNVNLTIKKGERVGLIGRNGAGKSTLLKLVTGNFAQTSGQVIVNGKVQALMNTGLGFHPEFTGMENIKASLLYNGLSKQDFNRAIDDIVDFVELGKFIDQPLKTYSLGMQTRLFFAVATAIQPEILIVDEVLGAGDTYFSAKSADRMKKLTNSGCTLLLVSHSTAQVLQFCDKAVWLECGRVVMEGKSIDVVKAYEEYSKKLELESFSKSEPAQIESASPLQSAWLREKLLEEVLSQHGEHFPLDNGDDIAKKNAAQLSPGISRWPAQELGLKIDKISMLCAKGQIINKIKSGQEMQIEITISADKADSYDVYFVILLFTEDGRWLTRHCSEKYLVQLKEGAQYSVRMRYDEMLLGNGKYVFSAAIYKVLDLNHLSSARYYDLLSRSFEFHVQGYHKEDNTLFYHPVTWQTEHGLSHLHNDHLNQVEV